MQTSLRNAELENWELSRGKRESDAKLSTLEKELADAKGKQRKNVAVLLQKQKLVEELKAQLQEARDRQTKGLVHAKSMDPEASKIPTVVS